MSRISPFHFNINEYNDEEIANICPRYLKWMKKVKAFDFSKRKRGKVDRSAPAFEYKYKLGETSRTPKRSKSLLTKIRKGGQNLRVRVRTSADLWRRWIRGGIMYNTELNERDELEHDEQSQEVATQVMPIRPTTVIIRVEPQPSKESTPPPEEVLQQEEVPPKELVPPQEESKQTENTKPEEEVKEKTENIKQEEEEKEIPQESEPQKTPPKEEILENVDPVKNEKQEESLKLEDIENSKTDDENEKQMESNETNNVSHNENNENTDENQIKETEEEKSESKDTQSIAKSEVSSEENTEQKTKENVINKSADNTNSNISIGNSSTGMPEVVANNY